MITPIVVIKNTAIVGNCNSNDNRSRIVMIIIVGIRIICCSEVIPLIKL